MRVVTCAMFCATQAANNTACGEAKPGRAHADPQYIFVAVEGKLTRSFLVKAASRPNPAI